MFFCMWRIKLHGKPKPSQMPQTGVQTRLETPLCLLLTPSEKSKCEALGHMLLSGTEQSVLQLAC